MDAMELLILIVSGFFSFMFLLKWYRPLFSAWPPERNKPAKYILGCLPVVSLAIILYTLRGLASFDVVDSFIYILFYILLGYSYLYFGLMLVACLFDLSWIDDALNLNNKAALASITGGFLGLAIIYSGANIGDGPGWWCVIWAGGLGLSAWIVLGLIINIFTGAFERITVERDVCCGIRFGFYLLAGGIILARASAGDWTSFYMTMVEFADGWPVLPLTALMIIVERHYILTSKTEYDMEHNYVFGSMFWGIVYVAVAAVSIKLLPPLPVNPLYKDMLGMFMRQGIIL